MFGVSWTFLGAIGAVVILAFVVWRWRTSKEGFGTSPGTLNQLSANHVPTEEDVEEAVEEQRRERREADDMTSEQSPV